MCRKQKEVNRTLRSAFSTSVPSVSLPVHTKVSVWIKGEKQHDGALTLRNTKQPEGFHFPLPTQKGKRSRSRISTHGLLFLQTIESRKVEMTGQQEASKNWKGSQYPGPSLAIPLAQLCYIPVTYAFCIHTNSLKLLPDSETQKHRFFKLEIWLNVFPTMYRWSWEAWKGAGQNLSSVDEWPGLTSWLCQLLAHDFGQVT